MIPSEFQILGQKIEVVYDDLYCHKNKCYGMYNSLQNKIILAKKYKDQKGWIDYKPEIIQATFFHELMHCLLFYSDSESWLDEKLVDKLGNFLHQYEISKCEKITI
jgi:hypothetical protein